MKTYEQIKKEIREMNNELIAVHYKAYDIWSNCDEKYCRYEAMVTLEKSAMAIQKYARYAHKHILKIQKALDKLEEQTF